MFVKNLIKTFSHIVRAILLNPFTLFSLGFVLFTVFFQAVNILERVKMPLGIMGLMILCLLISIIIIWGKNGRENNGKEGQKTEKAVSHIGRSGFGFIFFALILLLSLFVSLFRLEFDKESEEAGREIWNRFTNEDSEIRVLISQEPVSRHQEVSITGTVLSASGQKIVFTLPRYPKVSVGDICFLKGDILEPENFSEFDYKKYLANKRVYRIIQVQGSLCKPSDDLPFVLNMKAKIMKFKAELIGNIDRNMPEPQSSLLAGIVFGQERVFSEDFDEAVKNAGVSHVVAASGYNISFVVGIVAKVFSFLSERKKFFTNLLFVWIYCVMTGLPSSIVRAGLMYTIAQVSKFAGFKLGIFNLMLFTLTLFMIIDPRVLSDIGFQLSYLATLGLVYLLPLAQSLVGRVGLSWMSESVLLPTFCCTLATLPVTVLTFGKLPILSILVNALVLPVIDSALMLGVGAVSIGQIFPSVSKLIYSLIWFQLKYFEGVVSFFGSISWATVSF